MFPGAALLEWASGESPTGEYHPPERPDGGSELESTYWVCGTTGWTGDKIYDYEGHVGAFSEHKAELSATVYK